MCDEYTPQNIPSANTTLGGKVVLYVWKRFSFSQCFCSFQGVDGKRQRGVVDQEQILVSNHFHCLDCLQLVDLVSVTTQYPDEHLMLYPTPNLKFIDQVLLCFTKCTFHLANRIFPTNLLLIICTLSSWQHSTSLGHPLLPSALHCVYFWSLKKKKSATIMNTTTNTHTHTHTHINS